MTKTWALLTAALLAGYLALAPGPAASAADVCRTGHRGQPAYDKACLRTGTPDHAAELWFSTPVGRRGAERDDFTTRRGICKFAPRHGGIRRHAPQLAYDVVYDTFRNHRQVNRWLAQDAALNCRQLGYRV